jgi:MFS family permease
VLRRFGFRNVLIGTALLAAAGVAVSAAFTPGWPLWLIFIVLAVGGLFRSLQFTALNTLAFADVPAARLSAATSFAGTVQQMAPALGVVLATTSLEVSASLAGHHTATVPDFAVAFVVAAVVIAASCPFFLRLSPDVGGEVSGHVVVPKRVAAE